MPNIQKPSAPIVPAPMAQPKPAEAAVASAAVSTAAAASAPTDSVQMSTDKARTPLQRHVDFFDRNHDHTITLGETFSGLRALGMGHVGAAFGAAFINGGLGSKTGGSLLKLTVKPDNIAAAKHDSDTDVYDEKGNFSPAKFDEMFAKWDQDKNGSLSGEEFTKMRTHNKESTAGAIGSKAEFGLLVSLAGTPTKVGGKEIKSISREQMQQFYNGSLFYHLAGEKVPFKE